MIALKGWIDFQNAGNRLKDWSKDFRIDSKLAYRGFKFSLHGLSEIS